MAATPACSPPLTETIFEVADGGDPGVLAAFDGDDGAGVFRFQRSVTGKEGDDAVNAFVGAFLLAGDGLGAEPVERPPLELPLVTASELLGAGEVNGLAEDLDAEAGEGVLHAAADETDGEVGDIDADPPAAELMGGMDSRAAAAEGVEDDVAGVGGRADDTLEEGEGFLRRVTEPLSSLAVDWRDVCPDIPQGLASLLVQVALIPRHTSWAGLYH